MSGNTFTCRDRYFNYGSYLRSRGYDKEICNLIVAIEQGQFPIGPIYPGNCSKRITTTIKGNVDIVPCEVTDNKPDATPPTPISGQLTVIGGYIGAGGIDVSNGTNIPTLVAQQAKGFGIQSNTGISSIGPIYQQTDCSHSNWFGAKDHLFVGGVGDCSTNVIVRGNLFVDGETVELNGFIGETLSLVTLPGNAALGTLNTFKSPISNGNMVDMYAGALSSVAALPPADQWKYYLSFAIDGNSSYNQTDVSGIDASGGMSNVMGHMRGFRGLTITNPPYNTPVDIEWNPDISGTNRAIDAYGSIRVQPGNTDGTGSPALGNIDISGGQFRIFQNDISNVVLSANGDASFNGRVSCYDLSVTNIATFGAFTTYIDTSNVNTSYVTVDNSLNTKFIYSPGEDLYINAFDGGMYSDIYMTALDIFMDADLSVNDVSSSNINNVGSIVTNDISVNSHASIYDLSVGIITIVNGEFTDLTVNNHTTINDLSVNGFSEFTGNFLINNITGGSEAITIQTNHGTNEKITIQTLQGQSSDSININSNAGGVNISAGATEAITFSAKDIIMSNSDLSANDISANIIQVNEYITSGGDITTTSSINAGSATITDLLTAGSGLITDLSVNTLQSTAGVDLAIKAGITGTFQDIKFSAKDIIMSSSDLSAGDISANNIQALGYITDGTATMSGGNLSSVGTIGSGAITSTGAVQGTSITDGTATMSSGNLSSVGTIGSGAITSTGAVQGTSITDGTATMSSGNLSSVGTIGSGAITSTGAVQGTSITDGTATMSSGNLSSVGTIGSGAITSTGAVQGTSITDGTATMSSGNLSSVGTIGSGAITSTGAVQGTSITDGTATMSSGNLSSVGTIGSGAITSTGAVQGTSITDGTATMSSGNLSSVGTIGSGAITSTGAVQGTSITDGTATLNAGALTGLTTVTANGDVTASNFILVTGGGNLLDLSNNVNLLDASMAIVEKVASLRYRASTSPVVTYNGVNYNGIKSFNIPDISDNLSISQTGLTVGEIKIPHTGIYSYNLQLACTTNNNVSSIDLAINNNTVNSPGGSNVNISSAGSTGGVNRKYVKDIDFSAPGPNTIGLSGISKFTSGDEVQLYINVSGTGGSVTLDSANESIFSMALLYATD